MAEKKLLLGDEAIALGAIHAGISGVYAYPGTPSTEITEFIQNNPLAKERKLHSTWCTNEKTAMEAALGMSYAGKRALVCMKHVGMNVAADAFVNSAITGVNGGLVVLAADDLHALVTERAGFTFLWKICYDSHAGTVFPTRSIRYDGLRIYTLGKTEVAGADACGYPSGTFACRCGSSRYP